MYGQFCNDKFVWTILEENVMTKNKTFQMRCDQEFLDTLDELAKEMHMSKASTVDVAVKIFPGLVQLQSKLERMIQEAREQLE